MICKSEAREIVKNINPEIGMGHETINYLDSKVEEFIQNLLEHSVEEVIAKKRVHMKPEHISSVLDKRSLILKIYPNK